MTVLMLKLFQYHGLTMYYAFVVCIFPLVVSTIIAATFDSDERFKVFPVENFDEIDKNGLKRSCCGRTVKSKKHEIENYPEVNIH